MYTFSCNTVTFVSLYNDQGNITKKSNTTRKED
jgi:hypothetical protein